MITPFRKGYRLTQKFGETKYFDYSQYGFKGHEGIDLVPLDGETDVVAIEEGVVVRDQDLDPGTGYGRYVVVLNKNTKRAWWYGHFLVNYVGVGQRVDRGTTLGKYGSSGRSSGPHLHLGLRLADDNGVAINQNNGYKGFIDPLQILESFNKNDPSNIQISTTEPISDEWKVNVTRDISELKGKIDLITKRVSNLEVELNSKVSLDTPIKLIK